jgi:hypothetical protein
MKQDCEKVVPVTISMPLSLARKARVYAAQHDKSRSRLVCEVLENALLSVDDIQSQEGKCSD